MYPIKFPG